MAGTNQFSDLSPDSQPKVAASRTKSQNTSQKAPFDQSEKAKLLECEPLEWVRQQRHRQLRLLLVSDESRFVLYIIIMMTEPQLGGTWTKVPIARTLSCHVLPMVVDLCMHVWAEIHYMVVAPPSAGYPAPERQCRVYVFWRGI